MNFWEIVKESEKDRHEVYALQTEKGLLFAPDPNRPAKQEDPTAELNRLRDTERRDRVRQLADLIGDNMAACENADACIASLLPEPTHITKGDADNAVFVSLLQGEG